MRNYLKVYLLPFFVVFSVGAELKYPVNSIPQSLKENTHTVMRLYKQELEIKSPKLALLKVTEVRTILNKNGYENVFLLEAYDPFNKITNIRGMVYDESGKRIKNLYPDDVIDRSYIDGYTLYNDNRVKCLDPKYLTYPLTVEYTYQVELKQTLFLPSWSHSKNGTSYENSAYTLSCPVGYPIKYKEYNLNSTCSKTKTEKNDIYSWTLSNLKAKIHEPMSAFSKPNYPMIDIVCDTFSVGDKAGSTKTWRTLGMWISDLNDKRDKLPESTIAKMKELTANCKSDFDKVKTIYEFMQKKSRYVSIQIGIGGWQPFEAEVVDRLSYGDCKALSNYMKALLSSVGVKSYYALVNAGSQARSLDVSFVSSHFNHAFLCVPVEHNDTLWLECTSQNLPCGFNSDFTDDRDVLLVDGERSRIVHTRVYPINENSISRTAIINLKKDESGDASVSTSYFGLPYTEILRIDLADNADKKRLVSEKINLPTFTLNSFNYTENRGKTPSYDENLRLSFANYLSKAGDNILLPLYFMRTKDLLPEKVRNRKDGFSIRRASLRNDSIVFQLPEGIQISQLPPKSEISTKFGRYTSTAVSQSNSIVYCRRLELYKGDFAPEAYAEYREFIEKVIEKDFEVASLKKM